LGHDAQKEELSESPAVHPPTTATIGITGGGKQDFNLTDILTKGAVASSNQYDGIGTIAHEFTEVMGRVMNFGAKSSGIPGYMPFDLFHFSSSTSRKPHLFGDGWRLFLSRRDVEIPTRSCPRILREASILTPAIIPIGHRVSNGPADAYDASGGQGSVLSDLPCGFFSPWKPSVWHGGNFTGVWG
jgi:hypothetical protein